MAEHERDKIDEVFEDFSYAGIRLSRRQQGLLMGGAVAALIFIAPFAIKEQKRIDRQKDAIERAGVVDDLAKKYDVSHLSQESQDAFWRLVQVSPEGIGDTNRVYQDALQTGERLQEDVAVLNAALVNEGKISDEYDLAEELIPEDTLREIKERGFEFTRLDPPYCDAGGVPSYRPFDYSNHLPKELKVTYVNRKDGEVVRIPLGTMQMPAPPEPLDVSTYVFSPLNRFETSLIANPRSSSPIPFYRIAGCAILPRGDRDARIKQVY